MSWMRETRTPSRSTARRFAPYPKTRTPANQTKNLPQNSRRSVASVSEDSHEYWEGVTKKTWHIYKSSPLYNFSTKVADLKTYSRVLSAHIRSTTTGTAVRVEEKADLAKFEHVKLSVGDSEREMVEITFKQKPSRGNGPDRIVLRAILSAVSSENESQSVEQVANFAFFPLMMVYGSTKLIEHLVSWLQGQFSCSVSVMNLPSMELCRIVAKFSGEVTGKKSKPVQFVYRTPDEIEGLSTITYDIDASDCQRVWQSFQTENADDDFTPAKVASFVMALESHFYHHFKVKLSAMKLYQIGTSLLCARVDGRVKIYSARHAHVIFDYLSNSASERTRLP